MQTPEQRGARGHFNDAVESEADKRDAAGQEACDERDESFETVVPDGEPFQANATSNVGRAVERCQMVHQLSIAARCVPRPIWYSSAAISDRGDRRLHDGLPPTRTDDPCTDRLRLSC